MENTCTEVVKEEEAGSGMQDTCTEVVKEEEAGSDMEDTCTVVVKEEEELEMESSEIKSKLKTDISFFTI